MTEIVPGKEYTRQEVAQFRDSPELANVLLRGYVFTLTLGGNFMLVPWNQAAGGGYSGQGTGPIDMSRGGSSYGQHKVGTFDKKDLPPIVKRTPQQRLDSLMSKVGEDLRLYLSGQAGHELGGEDAKRVAQEAIEKADEKFEAEERRKIVRTTGDPYA